MLHVQVAVRLKGPPVGHQSWLEPRQVSWVRYGYYVTRRQTDKIRRP